MYTASFSLLESISMVRSVCTMLTHNHQCTGFGFLYFIRKVTTTKRPTEIRIVNLQEQQLKMSCSFQGETSLVSKAQCPGQMPTRTAVTSSLTDDPGDSGVPGFFSGGGNKR